MLCVAWYMLLTDRTRESRTPLKLYGWFVTWKDISETISRADFDCQHFNRKVFLMNSFYDERFLKSPSFLNNSLYVDNLSLNISLKNFDNFNCYNDCGTSMWKLLKRRLKKAFTISLLFSRFMHEADLANGPTSCLLFYINPSRARVLQNWALN